MPEFPSQTHAFFWREASALRSLGVDVRHYSTCRPSVEACPHAFATEARALTHYLFPPRFEAALRLMVLRPGRVVRCLRYLAGLRESRPMARVRLAGLILSAADLVSDCEAAGIGWVHIHSFADSAHLGALAAILGDIRYSLTLHGDLPVYGRDHRSKMAGASLVTAVTLPLKLQITDLVPGQRVPVISMGVDVDRFTPVATADGRAGPIHVVSVARLNYAKGHVYLLEAISRLRREGLDIRASFAGSGPYEAEIRTAITERGLDEWIAMMGSISEDEVVALIRSADVFALTSFGQGEAAPVAVMEAMACGVPVVCSRIGGTGDMITDGVDGILVAQKDAGAIADALRRLIGDAPGRHRMGHAARETAVRRFDYRVKAAEFLAEIKAVEAAAARPVF